MALKVVPIKLRDAMDYVRQNHRHHAPPQGALFAIGASIDEETICGVVIVGRPVSRLLDDGWTVEATRLCTNGMAKNTCSFLYSRAWRAAKSMGYRKLITYTLSSEQGVSCVASGFRIVAETSGGSWDREKRARVDRNPRQKKFRWEISS